MRRVIYCVTSPMGHGFCNRIKCLLTSMRLAEWIDADLRLAWSPGLVQRPFGFFFDSDASGIEVVHPDDVPPCPTASEWCEVPAGGDFAVSTWRMWVFGGEIEEGFCRGFYDRGKRIHDCRGRAIDYEFNRIPSHILEAYRRQLQRLVWSSTIKAEADRYDVSGCVGVHIRKAPDWDAWPRPCSPAKFVRAMAEHTERFFLSAHTPQVTRAVEEEYPGRVVCRPTKLDEGVADLLLLSRCKSIIGSHLSTWSEMAWWLGGCKQPVAMIE